MAFLLLSDGSHRSSDRASLAPEFDEKSKPDILDSDPGVDPINIKNDYFNWIKARDPTSSFGKLLQIAKDHRQSPADIVDRGERQCRRYEISGAEHRPALVSRLLVQARRSEEQGCQEPD